MNDKINDDSSIINCFDKISDLHGKYLIFTAYTAGEYKIQQFSKFETARDQFLLMKKDDQNDTYGAYRFMGSFFDGTKMMEIDSFSNPDPERC